MVSKSRSSGMLHRRTGKRGVFQSRVQLSHKMAIQNSKAHVCFLMGRQWTFIVNCVCGLQCKTDSIKKTPALWFFHIVGETEKFNV